MSKSGLLVLMGQAIPSRSSDRRTEPEQEHATKLSRHARTVGTLCCRRTEQVVDRLDIFDLSSEVLRGFLDHLEQNRRCSIRTRNQRLAAVHAMARLHRRTQPRTYRLVQPVTRRPIQAIHTERTLLYGQARDGCCPRGSQPPHRARVPRSCAPAVPLQLRCSRLRSRVILLIGDLNCVPTNSATCNCEVRDARCDGARSGRRPSTHCSPLFATGRPTNPSF